MSLTDRELSPWAIAIVSSSLTLCVVLTIAAIAFWVSGTDRPGQLLKRGTWRPAILSDPLATVLLGALPVIPLSVGIDYVLPSDLATQDEYRVLLSALPIQAWGTFCLVAALILITGLVMRWGWWVITGLWATGSVITVMAVGQFLAVFPNRWWDGMHDSVFSMAIALIYWGLAIGYAQQNNDDDR